MTNNNDSINNPAIAVNNLIDEFDKILSNAGAQTIATTIARKASSATASFANQITAIAQEKAYRKLSSDYDLIIETVAEIIAELDEESYFSTIKLSEIPDIVHDDKTNIISCINYVTDVKRAIQPLIDDEVGSNKKKQFLSAIKNKKTILNKGFYYEFTDGDLDRIQQLVNELRAEISSSELFEESHKQRLLRRLEAMQSEMHKKMSDVDKIWGLVGDAGIAVGKFGEDAKPFVDRIKELSKIAFRTQARAEELPSDSTNPLLGNDADDDK